MGMQKKTRLEALFSRFRVICSGKAGGGERRA
jgi:hypothetical protein